MIIPPESPVAVRKVLPPLSPTLSCHTPVVQEPKGPLPLHQLPIPIPPPPPPPYSTCLSITRIQEPVPPPPQRIIKAPAPLQDPSAPKPEPPPHHLTTPTRPPPEEPVQQPKVLVSVGCQTEYDPFFPPMQA